MFLGGLLVQASHLSFVVFVLLNLGGSVVIVEGKMVLVRKGVLLNLGHSHGKMVGLTGHVIDGGTCVKLRASLTIRRGSITPVISLHRLYRKIRVYVIWIVMFVQGESFYDELNLHVSFYEVLTLDELLHWSGHNLGQFYCMDRFLELILNNMSHLRLYIAVEPK